MKPRIGIIGSLLAAGLGAIGLGGHKTQAMPLHAMPLPDHSFGGGASFLPKSPSPTPKEWGMSTACAKMVRKNRLRRAGVAGQRI